MYHTIIIGAGIAGISAGQYLTENCQDDFLVLESADIIGGRVRTIEFNGKVFPTGPGWLHGKKGNPIYDIIHDLDIPIEECYYDHEAFFVWDAKQGKEITDEYLEKSYLFEKKIELVLEKLNGLRINPEDSFSDILQNHSGMLNVVTDIDRMVIFTNKEIFVGAAIGDMSGLIEVRSDGIYDNEEGEVNFRILDPNGVPKMIDYLSQNLEDKIELNCKVNKIMWDEDQHLATILVNDGREFLCRNVVITLQCDMLANNAIVFEPEMPSSKTLAWRHVSAVNYCRVFAKFPRRFWPDKEWLISVVKDVDPFDELTMWQNCQKQNLCSADDNILICHFTSGYNRGSSRFDVDRASLIDLVTESMKNMFPTTYCQPDDVMFVSHWKDGRFSGAFSVTAPGFSDTMSDELIRSIGPLHFAGESVSVPLMGTMQGAYVTGREAAQRVCQCSEDII